MAYRSFKVLEVSWTDLKSFKTRDGFSLYYTTFAASYKIYGISNHLVYVTPLTVAGEVTDFETNFKPGATEVDSLDSALGQQNSFETYDAILVDPSGNAAVGTRGSAFPGTTGVVFIGGSDGTNARSLAMTTGGLAKVALSDGSANALTSTSNALDINIKTSSINVPISIAAQTLAAVAISRTNTANAVGNPIFVELSDGTAAFGTGGNPFSVSLTGTNSVRIQDSSGNSLNSTSGDLNVSLRDSAGTAITLSGGNLKSSLFDSSGNAAILTDNQASPAAGAYGIVVVGGNDGSNIRDISVDSSGRQIFVKKNANFGPTTTASIAAGSSGNVSVTTGSIHQILLLLEVRPSVADNTFTIDIYKDSGRTKRIFTLSNITSDEFVTDEHLAMYLVDSIMYITITNNNIAGARTYTIEGVVEVRS